MKIGTTISNFWIKASLLILAIFFTITSGQIGFSGFTAKSQQVLLDSHSAAKGLSNWTITTNYPNELIIISAGGYGTGGNTLHTTPGTVTVNGNNATYITRGEWLNFNFTWVCEIWAYVAPTPGTYNCACTELTLNNTYYLNFASSVYQPNCPIGLNLGNIVVGGSDSNHGPTTITASITTTENGSWIYGTIDNNDNGGTGKVAWNGQLTPLDYTYSLGNGVDGAQADSTYANAGTYTITSTDIGASNVWMTIALIAVQPNPSCCALSATANIISNENCFGDTKGSAYGIPAKGHAPYTYLWMPIFQTTDTATGLSAGTYSIIISDTVGCSATATVNITQPSLLSASVTPVNIACFGGTGHINSTVSGGTGPYTYSWNTTPIQTTAIATNLPVGTYTLNVTDSHGCTASAFASITQPATAVTVALTGPAIICLNTQGTLKAVGAGGTPGYKYTWSGPGINTPKDSTCTITPMTQTDTVKVTDANGCTASAEITVVLGPTMNVAITGPGSICQGLSTTLCSNVTGGTGGNMYTWQPGNAKTPCDAVSPSSTTTYTLTVIDNCGTTATTTATLRINPLPVTAFTSSLFAGCTPLCIQFYNTTTLAQGNSSTYLWKFGNGDSSRSQNPSYCYPRSGGYNVALTVTSDSGCSNTLNKLNFITAYGKPNTAFTYSPQPATILSPTVQFINQSNDPYPIVSWIWNFGDGTDSVSNAANPIHTYQDTGRYCVTMIAMDEHGCSDTATNCFAMEPNYTLYIPSAFTPNNDHVNDVFVPVGQYIKNFDMYIFDRWGMQLYHTTDITKGWDGTVGGGTPVQEDTYVYKITVTDSEGNNHTYIGNVTLLK